MDWDAFWATQKETLMTSRKVEQLDLISSSIYAHVSFLKVVAARKDTCPCEACHKKASRAVAPRKSAGFGKK
jgi:hypothetical protein